jgi:tetratricopeptide (TPR) repeat protein
MTFDDVLAHVLDLLKRQGHVSYRALKRRFDDPPEVAPAETAYQHAIALAEELGMRPLQAHCHLGLGKLYGKMGRHDKARRELLAAIDLYRAMEMTLWLPRAEAALAEVEGR